MNTLEILHNQFVKPTIKIQNVVQNFILKNAHS